MTDNVVDLIYCRKCTKELPPKEFYDAVDNGLVDTNGKMSVCKDCVQKIYNQVFEETQSMEKSVHKLCIVLNIKFSNEALDATKKHVQTMMENGKNVTAIFSIYKMKLTATNKSMDKSITQYEGYEDVGTIFTEKQIDTKEIPIPSEVIKFWGNGKSRGDIEYLETEYANFKNTHSTDTYAEIVLLKEFCETMLKIKKLRENNDPDTGDAIKELRDLMKSLKISPDAARQNNTPGADTFGQWIADIEKEEPAQWLLTDPRGDIYRDVSNIDDYYQKYIVRPIKNFIQGSKDFNVDEKEGEDFELDPSEVDNFAHIDDGEAEDDQEKAN
jgi:hypothetical protein